MPDEVHTVREGWLMKRGEYIKNWRPRYFVLSSNGLFLGYKDKVKGELGELNKCFSIERCQIMRQSKPKPNVFIIRCFQLTTLVEMTFAVDSPFDREEWISALEEVSQRMSNKDFSRRSTIKADSTNSTHRPEMTLEDFEMLKVLGKGRFAKVMLGKEKKTGNVFAIKLLRKNVILAKDQVEKLTENLLQNTNHPFLTELKYSFQTNDRLVFVMEYVNGGELSFHLSRDKVFSEARVRFYGAEITLALKYLHENKILYRSLKMEHLLIDSDGHIKITDFGSCKQKILFADITFCGKPEYLAPELLEDSDYGPVVNWWEFGLVLYEMLCGQLPFYNPDLDVLFELILHEPVRFPSQLSARSKNILSGLLEKSPEKRLGGSIRDAEEVMSHEFFNDINWNDVLLKKIASPFKPTLDNKEDVKYFDEDFTRKLLSFRPLGSPLDSNPYG